MFVLPLLLSLTLTPPIAKNTSPTLRDGVALIGVVVDSNGHPVAGANVCTSVGRDKNALKAVVTYVENNTMKYGVPVKADSEGRFEIDLKGPIRYPLQITAFDHDGSRIGVNQLASPEEANHVRLVLVPAGHVHFKIEGTTSASTMAWMKKANGPYYYGQSGPTADLTLPEGKYDLSVFGPGVEPIRQDIEVHPARTIELGTLTLKTSVLSGLYGKPAPALAFADASGVDKDFSLEQAKGKWVIIEFWGFWCEPCVHESLPSLMAFNERNAAYHDKFQILTVHESNQVQTIAALKPMLASLETGEWKKPLPFPVLMDNKGETVKRYGITVFPTLLLIDPNGTLVKDWSLADLEKKFK